MLISFSDSHVNLNPELNHCDLFYRLVIWIELYCDTDSYGSDCTHCVPVDRNNIGHYICDTNTGEKQCLPGMFYLCILNG